MTRFFIGFILNFFVCFFSEILAVNIGGCNRSSAGANRGRNGYMMLCNRAATTTVSVSSELDFFPGRTLVHSSEFGFGLSSKEVFMHL